MEGLVSETDEVCSHASTNDPLVGQPSQLVVNLCEGMRVVCVRVVWGVSVSECECVRVSVSV